MQKSKENLNIWLTDIHNMVNKETDKSIKSQKDVNKKIKKKIII